MGPSTLVRLSSRFAVGDQSGVKGFNSSSANRKLKAETNATRRGRENRFANCGPRCYAIGVEDEQISRFCGYLQYERHSGHLTELSPRSEKLFNLAFFWRQGQRLLEMAIAESSRHVQVPIDTFC